MNGEQELELNAYVDGELSADQQAELIEAMRDDPDLARRACELSHHKARMRLAYAEPPPPRPRAGSGVKTSWSAMAAGVALMAFGIVSGWLLHAGTSDWHPGAKRFVMLDAEGRGQAPALATEGETRIVFHLTNADQQVAAELLDEVELMLRAYQIDNRPLRVEVVSHSDGLQLLRTSLTQHAGRIHEMSERFENLTFVACQNTINRLKVEHGIEVELVPDAEVIDSGVSHVVNRQKEGWSYIRV